MLRVRLLLTLFVTVFTTLAILSYESPLPDTGRALGVVLASIIAISGLTVFTFTLFKSRIAEDGSVCFSKNHPIHWMTIVKLENGASLCGTTWGTVLPISLLSGFCALLFMIVFGTFKIIQDGKAYQLPLGLGIVLALFGVTKLIEYLLNRFASDAFRKRLARTVVILVILFLVVLITVLLPLSIQKEAARNNQDITFGEAALKELVAFLSFAGIFAAIIGLVWLAFKVVPVLATTGFGRFIKEQLCPVMRTCPPDGGCDPPPVAETV